MFPIEKMKKGDEEQFTEQQIQKVNKYMKLCSNSPGVR